METLETITAERLIELGRYYQAVCERTKTKPTTSDFVMWLAEEGYIDAE